jgi:D-glycero-alpha-D-manno-heptose-7-phosphate kinase
VGATIRSRAPLRLGLAGGGTDLSPFCDMHGGAVLNCTIDRYAHAFVAPRSDDQVVFEASDLQVQGVEAHEEHPVAASFDSGEGLRLHRAVYDHFRRHYAGNQPLAVTVATAVDAPPGSGLGSSSALVVALCEAFRAYCHAPLGLYDLARLAFEIERIELRMAGGKQDHYAAVFGGVNFIELLPDGSVLVSPIRVERAILNEIEASLVICFTGVSRTSDTIIREQMARIVADDAVAIDALFALKAAAIEMKQALLAGRVGDVAAILDASWRSKQRTAESISTGLIDRVFETGRKAGARAGKISGAGGGGFMMFVVDPEDRIKVVTALNRAGGTAGPVHLTTRGVESWEQPGLAR